MDVTFGLLSNLVKTRSIQRVLAPIASQISLLIILNESEDGSQLHLCKMVPCAKVVMQAAYKLVSVAKQQAKLSSDKEFDAQMVGGCEVLELASSGLYVAAERMEASSSSPEARAKLVQASKDVLQATMKVLLVADDAEIRRLVTAANIVTEKLSCLNLAENMMDLVQRFKEFTDALTVFTALTDRRQRDTISARQRERMVTSLTIMKKSVSSLSVSLQNSVRYRHNPQAQLGKAYVMNEMQTAVGEIVDTVQNKDMDRDDLSPHEAGAFVCSIDLALECLSEGRRAELHMDLELWTEEVVRHSMTVAHLCYNTHRDMIVATCQRVIQEKCRVVELHRAHVSNLNNQEAKCDFYDVCEALTDEFCELEKNVNVALLHLVVEHFKETTEPLERLIKAALKPGKGECLDGESACLEEFEESAERICQIAILAAASSTDARRVQVIRVSVQRLESLEPDVVAGAMTLAKAPHNTGAVRHLKLLMREWSMEMTNLLQVLDEMTDPRMFMLVSERKVEEDLHTCNGCILLSDLHGVTVTWQSAIGRSRRVAQVAERVVDASDDALYRNGLMAFVKKLKKVITSVRLAGENLLSDPVSPAYRDMLRRRFEQLQEALARVKAGLNEANHPHVLSPLRRNVRGKPTTSTPKSPVLQSTTDSTVKVTEQPRLKGHLHSDQIIATSVPSLHARLQTSKVEALNPEVRQKMEKSRSVGHIEPRATPDTHAWKLATDLLSWSTKGDKQRVNQLCGDALGWTNHVADVAQSVLKYCMDTGKKKEMSNVCFSMDEIVSELVQSAKYVLHGDFSHLTELQTQSYTWATQVEQVRVYVDIMTEPWFSLVEDICGAVMTGKADLVMLQLESVQGHHKALTDLVTCSEKIGHEVQGHKRLEALRKDKSDLDDLTVTFKTTAQVATEQGVEVGVSQVEQVGREWAGKMFSMTSDFELVCEALMGKGKGRKLWTNLEGPPEEVAEALEGENKKIKELMKSACYGDDDLQTLYKGCLGDMRECVEELKALANKRYPAHGLGPHRALYNSLLVGLHKGAWVVWAIQCVDLARQQCAMYAGPVDAIIEHTFTIKITHGDKRDGLMSEFEATLDRFSMSATTVHKKVLSGIQLSSELTHRSAVRQCLDGINKLAPAVVNVLRQLVGTSSSEVHGLVLWHRLLWCSKVHHLIRILHQMSDLKPTLLKDVQNLLAPESQESPSFDSISERLQQTEAENQPGPAGGRSPEENAGVRLPGGPSILAASYTGSRIHNSDESHDPRTKSHDLATKSHGATVGPHYGTKSSKNSTSISNTNSGSKNGVLDVNNSGTTILLDKCISGEDVDNLEPVIVNLEEIEEQIILNASQQLEQTALSEDGCETAEGSSQTNKHSALGAKPTQAKSQSPDRQIFELLKGARYIERETSRWADTENAIVKVASTMAQQINHMTQYVHHEGPIKTHLGLVETAKALAGNSDRVLQFANTLAKHCVDKSFSTDLVSYCVQVPLVRQQLMILANVQLGTANTNNADRTLVQNGQNLMRKIIQTIQACEAVCVKGFSESLSAASRSAYLLATRWRQQLLAHRQHRAEISGLDDLGLRIVEGNDLQPSLTHIFSTA
ncbi:uncharacterized protein LOC128211918 isoform X1 [Mya arenaria]|uniref:uncharacterized protein LOC128211918 isoform X1 n=1 Tax=Mya arenaria TaxID=6604 RepID=UPI0022E07426|nr:uncharacterized protein LOC128211918 isoform X1 [Mya arenaria]